MRRRVVFIETLDNGPEIELEFAPVDNTLLQAKIADKYVVAYLVHDFDADYDNLMGECMGQLYSAHRHSGQHSKMQDALGLDSTWEPNLSLIFEQHFEEALKRYTEKLVDTRGVPFLAETYLQTYDPQEDSDEIFVRSCARLDCEDARDWEYVLFDSDMQDVLRSMFDELAYFPGDKDAVSLDCYSHSGEWWSLAGHGMQCQWDTANGAGVWVPDKCLREQLDADEAAGKDRRAQAVTYCTQFLDHHNAICSGDVYGCVCHVYDESGEMQGTEIGDEVWGLVGCTYAEETLKEEFFDPTCERVQKEYDEAVRSGSGRQTELTYEYQP